jgi:hypothetical protein
MHDISSQRNKISVLQWLNEAAVSIRSGRPMKGRASKLEFRAKKTGVDETPACMEAPRQA